MMSSEAASSAHSDVDSKNGNLRISHKPDGSISRQGHITEKPSMPDDPSHSNPVLSKDITFDKSKNAWVRIFLPRRVLVMDGTTKLPLLVFFHGGGFILLGPSSSVNHDFCLNMAETLGVVVVSVKYRLAPEHRLPAAYTDANEALHWIKATQDDWLENYADVSNCFIMGTSAGANIAYHVGLHATEEIQELEPLKIRGLILHQPCFGGCQRTSSELRLMKDPILPLSAIDRIWELSLPVGADRDHDYSNPTVRGGSELLEKIKRQGWKVMVFGCHGDPLVDRGIELAKLMEEKGVEIVSHFTEGGYHGYGIMNDSPAAAMFQMLIKEFLAV